MLSFVSSGEFVKGLGVLWNFVEKFWNDINYVVIIYLICVKIEFDFILRFNVVVWFCVFKCFGGKMNM